MFCPHCGEELATSEYSKSLEYMEDADVFSSVRMVYHCGRFITVVTVGRYHDVLHKEDKDTTG